MKKSSKDTIIIGFALFAMFFGAGNLIFPPSLGHMTGSSYTLAILGFVLTGVGLPFISLIACANYDGSFKNITDKVGKRFSLILNIFLMFTLGPLLVIPRTAATTYELGFQPVFGNINPLICIVIYFTINLFFVMKPSSVVDTIGKYLTPTLIVMLSTIIIKGIITPIGTIGQTKVDSVFSTALLEGYQTMDVLGAIVFSSIVISAIKSHGYKSKKEILNLSFKAGLVSVGGLALIYGGLTFLGAQTSGLYADGIGRSALVIDIARNTLGFAGIVALGVAVSLACLTTSIGLTTTISDFFTKLFKGKVSYNTIAIIITVMSIGISTLGVDKIVSFAGSILGILYPLAIVLIFTSFIYKFIGRRVMACTTYVTLIISLLNTAMNLGFGKSLLEPIFNKIPLSQLGFAWVLPAVITFVLSLIITKIFKQSDTETETYAFENN